ncbi:MAG: hflK [Verrucomicrobiaceae bacterium]|nr:hflK [Verrucomicrobiaceae bacterium]
MEISPQKILVGLIALIVFIGAFSSFYTVPTDSEGIVLRLGKYYGTTQPGLHFKLPFGIDTREIIPVRRQLKMEFGYATGGASNPYQVAQEPEDEKSMVTGDLNAASVEWVVQYSISDSQKYLFDLSSPSDTLRDISEAVMREIVGDRTVDEVLTVGRQEAEVEALKRLQSIVDSLRMGMHIDQVQLLNVNPPHEVQTSFDEVNRAQQEKEQMIQQARGEYNKLVPRAKGEAEQKISAAQGYATKRVNEAQGDAGRFIALLTEYQKAPDATRKRIYLETLGEILPNIPGKVILDDKVPQFLPMMQLQQLRLTQPQPQPQQQQPTEYSR